MHGYLDIVLDKFNAIKVNTVKVPSNINSEVLNFGKLIQEISGYVNAQTKEIRRDGIIRSKWKANILDYSNIVPFTEPVGPTKAYKKHKYDLNVDRGFKNVYQMFIKYLKDGGLQEHITYIKKASDPVSGIGYVKGLIDLGLGEEAL